MLRVMKTAGLSMMPASRAVPGMSGESAMTSSAARTATMHPGPPPSVPPADAGAAQTQSSFAS